MTKNNRRRRKNAIIHTIKEKSGNKGGRFTPPSNPPDTTASPWYPLTLSQIVAPGEFTFKDLIDVFQSQLNASKTTFNSRDFNTDTGEPFRVQIRFDSITVWSLTGRIVSLTVWDVEEQTTNSSDQREKDQLGAWVDCGGASCFPAIGYRYPPAYREKVYRPDPRYAGLSIATTTGGTRDSILYQIRIHWRTDSLPKFSVATQPIRDLETRLAKLQADIDSLNEVSNDIHASQPSTITKIVEGIAIVASYVAPLVAESDQRTLGSASAVAKVVAGDSRSSSISFEDVA